MRTIGHRPSFDHPDLSHWEKIRTLAIERDQSCVMCMQVHDLECHHRTYERFGHELLSDVYMLCKDCHLLITGAQMKLRYLQQQLKSMPTPKIEVSRIPFSKLYR